MIGITLPYTIALVKFKKKKAKKKNPNFAPVCFEDLLKGTIIFVITNFCKFFNKLYDLNLSKYVVFFKFLRGYCYLYGFFKLWLFV